MKALLSTVFDMSLTASWVILAVLAIRLLLRKAPRKYAYALWSAVAFRLCCPVSFSSALSLFNLPITDAGIVHRQSTTVTQTTQTPVQVIPNSPVTPVTPVTPAAPQLPATGGASSAVSSTVADILPNTPSVTVPAVDMTELWLTAAAVIWCVGMAALLVYAAVSYLRLHRQLSTAIRLEGNIYQSDQVRSPFILGFLRPKIYIPFSLDADSLRYVIAHERTHLKRLDHIIKPLSFLLLTIHWFNPLVWLAFYLMSRDMEMSCDEAVLAHEGNIRKAYSTTLLSFAANRRFPTPSPLAFSETGVKSRIRNVLNWKKPTAWITAAALLICSVALIACAADPNETLDNELPDPFGHSYRVTDILLRSDPAYRSHLYRLTEGCALEVNDGDGWVTVGKLTEFTLSKANFDAYITESQWNGEVTAEALRKNLNAAWQLVTEDDEMYLLLQTRDDERYLAYGYHDSGNDTTPKSDDSLFLWLAELEKLAESTETEASPTTSTYLSAQCIYMSPLSSYSDTDDSGYRYQITDGAAIITHRSSGEAVTLTPEEWGWQEFPWTDIEWEALFSLTPWMAEAVSELYDEMLYQPLNDEYCLLRMDGTEWIVKFSTETGTVWSIYALKPETLGGSAQWAYMPYLSSRYPAFAFTLDLPDGYTASAYCQQPMLALKTDPGVTEQVQIVEAADGDTFYWYPHASAAEIYPLSDYGEIHLYLQTPEGKQLETTICIDMVSSDTGTPTGIPTYSAALTGTDFVIRQSEDDWGAVVSLSSQAELPDNAGTADFSITVTSGGVSASPYLHVAHTTEYEDGQWLSSTGREINTQLLTELSGSIPTVTLGRDFRIDYEGDIYGPSQFTLYDSQGRQIEDYQYYYGLTFLNWLEQGEYYLTFRISANGEYISSEDRYESTAWEGIVRLAVPEKLAEPLPLGAKLDLVSAEMRIDGTPITVTDEAALNQLEKLFAKTKTLPGGAGCPFGSVLYLTCADGTVYSLCHSEDSCSAIFAGGEYYRYSGDGDAFWDIFTPGANSTPRLDTSEATQLKLIADSVKGWALDPDFADDCIGYAVTDLDGNGRLELIAANYGGTGHYTYTTYYEVNYDCTALEKLRYEVKEGDSQPDIMLSGTIPVFYGMNSSTITYILRDELRISATEYYTSYRALTLKDDEVTEELLASQSTLIDDSGNRTDHYRDRDGNTLTAFDYSNAFSSYFQNHIRGNAVIHWLTFWNGESILELDSDMLLQQLTESREGFFLQEYYVPGES